MKILHSLHRLAFACAALVAAGAAHAESLTAAQQSVIDAKFTEIKTWAADPVVVRAVVAQNTTLPDSHAAMTQEKWKSLTVIDPFVRSFGKNDVGAALKTRKTAWVSEAFVNDAKGLKVGFLNKTSGWSHAASAKHTAPLAGKTWQGGVELDESTGLQQIQIAVPVLDGATPVGSLVVGIALSKLE